MNILIKYELIYICFIKITFTFKTLTLQILIKFKKKSKFKPLHLTKNELFDIFFSYPSGYFVYR